MGFTVIAPLPLRAAAMVVIVAGRPDHPQTTPGTPPSDGEQGTM